MAPEAFESEPSRTAMGSLPFSYDLYSFRGSRGHTTVIAAFAVSVDELKRRGWNDGVRYRFDVSFVLADTARHTVFRSDDSVYVATPFALPGDHILYTFVDVDAAPSRTAVHRVVMTDANDPGVGQLYGDEYSIPNFSGDALMISDIALSQPNPPRGWRRGDVTLALLPTDLLPGSAFDLYYEVYNVANDVPYSTEIVVEPVDAEGNPEDRGGGAVRTQFQARTRALEDRSLREIRHIQASLDRGRYRISVTVTDSSTGRRASRSRLFQVTGPGRGATLVPALPSAPGN